MTTILTERRHQPAREELLWMLQSAKPPRRRSMREFAEQEIIIPDGPFAGRRFRCDRQPYTGLFFDAVDSGRFNRFNATGPTQSGKTLTCYVTPLLYHLFELQETVVAGIPDKNMALDKWNDVLPTLEASRYRELLPRSGAGSRGGTFDTIRFRNGVVLKFMSGGGGDKSRAAFTTRVVVVTETDGLDTSGGTSREADKLTQIEARTRAFGSNRRVYLECTVTTEDGRTWREHQNGTNSVIYLRCPRCRNYVDVDRDNLVGWQDADNIVEASNRASFACPSCGKPWSESQRRRANEAALLVHKGQEIKKGVVVGDVPATPTLGFRWSAPHNLFITAGDVAADEWRGARDVDEDNAEKELLQFVWAKPHKPSAIDLTELDATSLTRRTVRYTRGMVPEDSKFLTVGVDIGKRLGHFIVLSFRYAADAEELSAVAIVDYGRFDIASDDIGTEKAIEAAVRDFRDLCQSGWNIGGEARLPDQVWIDSGYKPDVIYKFVRESGQRFRACKGYGEAQDRRTAYSRPKKKSAVVRYIGEEYHVSALKPANVLLFEVNSDYWKTWAHERLASPVDAPGAMTLFHALSNEHISLAKHLTAEHQVEEFVVGKGLVRKWVRDRRSNHWLDALYLACAAGHFCGARLLKTKTPPRAAPQTRPPNSRFKTPDGRPFLVTER